MKDEDDAAPSSSTPSTQRPPLQISLRTKGRGFTSQFDVDDEARYAGKVSSTPSTAPLVTAAALTHSPQCLPPLCGRCSRVSSSR